MKVSYVVPHRNRVELFERNLQSLLAQTSTNFEIIVSDTSDDNGKRKLESVVSLYRNKGLDIKIFYIDNTKCPFSHNIKMYGGNFNPAVQQNVAAKKASGDILVLTSPEVINARTNVQVISEAFTDGKSKFLLGWIDERPAHVVPVPEKGITVEEIKTLCARSSWGAMCRPERWNSANYFLGCLLKKDFIKIGGIEEKYMAGIAWEDNDFGNRCALNGFPAEFFGDIAGIHLSHPRGYQGNLNSNSNPNKILWETFKPKMANEGFDWGNDSYIVGTF